MVVLWRLHCPDAGEMFALIMYHSTAMLDLYGRLRRPGALQPTVHPPTVEMQTPEYLKKLAQLGPATHRSPPTVEMHTRPWC